jgi:hypothetical protein
VKRIHYHLNWLTTRRLRVRREEAVITSAHGVACVDSTIQNRKAPSANENQAPRRSATAGRVVH